MAVEQGTLLLLRSDHIGDGEIDLGAKLLQSFLRVLISSGSTPQRVICMNSGVFLTTEGSPVVEQMRQLEADGAEILSCGTCLDYYDRKDRLLVGKPGTMQDTVSSLLGYAKVIAP